MKITAEHYETLKAAIRPVVERHVTSRANYKALGYTEKRYRWDLCYTATINGKPMSDWICKVIYPYANDEHIDTALRRIVKELEGV